MVMMKTMMITRMITMMKQKINNPFKLKQKHKVVSIWKPMKPTYKRTVREQKLIRTNPWGDRDRDLVPNWIDCKPFNKRRQGTLVKIYKKEAQKYLPQVQKLAEKKNDMLYSKAHYKDIETIMKKPGKYKRIEFPKDPKLTSSEYVQQLKKESALYDSLYRVPYEKDLFLIIDKSKNKQKEVIGFLDTYDWHPSSTIHSEELEIGTLYIEPEHRNKKIGTKIVKGLIKNKNINKITGHITKESEKFWKKMGAKIELDTHPTHPHGTFELEKDSLKETEDKSEDENHNMIPDSYETEDKSEDENHNMIPDEYEEDKDDED